MKHRRNHTSVADSVRCLYCDCEFVIRPNTNKRLHQATPVYLVSVDTRNTKLARKHPQWRDCIFFGLFTSLFLRHALDQSLTVGKFPRSRSPVLSPLSTSVSASRPCLHRQIVAILKPTTCVACQLILRLTHYMINTTSAPAVPPL